jgi:hypothetical protein
MAAEHRGGVGRMGKRSGVPETDDDFARLTTVDLERELRSAKLRAPHLGPLPRKGIEKRIHRLEKAIADRTTD